jgi:hypothetical protein
MWGPEKGRTDIVEGVEVEVVVPQSDALTVRRGGECDSVLAQMRSLAV